MITNKKSFYDFIRPSLFSGKISTKQLEGLEAILEGASKYNLVDLRQLSYVLATVYHETDKTMQPIEEYGKGKAHKYGKKIKYSGKSYSYPDKIYYGRGHTQNTWYEIYEKLSHLKVAIDNNWNFLETPELLLLTEPSVFATFYAMQNGLYTGKKLSDYINDKKTDFVNARRIINGTDKAQVIADIADKFYFALVAK